MYDRSANSKAEFPGGLYVLAASVLDTFNPDTIQPLRPVTGTQELVPDEAFGALLSHSVATRTGESSFAWRLSDETRKQAIGFLYSHNLLEHALELNAHALVTKNSYQDIFEQYATGKHPTLEGQSLEQLQASLQAIRLLGNTDLQLPEEHEVASMVMRESALEQLRRLADRHFAGRDKQLRILEEFVDAVPSSSLWKRLTRSAGNIASDLFGKRDLVQRWPFLVTGRGGIGKSAFLAKFLLDHISRVDDGTLAFAYLDFDRTAIWPDEPLTLLADIASQLSNQMPAIARPLLDMHGRIVAELGEGQSFTADYDSLEALTGSNLSASRTPRYVQEFKSILSKALTRKSGITLLLLMDTFEEVTQRGTTYVDSLWSFIEGLQDVLPRLRVVISGRSGLPKDIPHGSLDLPPLEDKTVNALLRAYGLRDQRNIDAITQRVGGHPLSIKLTVQLLESMAREGATLDDCARDRLFEDKWNRQLIDGVLYRRIVDHIDDPIVKKLANPGFALREVTPQIILDVLSGPCALDLSSIDEAKAVFLKLARYNSLVSPRSEWILHHRPEIRAMVLDKLQISSHQQCLDIWSNAVRFYSMQQTIRGRAEELYYRMMLGTPLDVLDERWIAGVEKHLMPTKNELPGDARAFLEYRVLQSDQRVERRSRGRELSSSDLRTAEEMRHALAQAQPERALETYERTGHDPMPDPTSPLFPLVARAYAQAREFGRALEMVERGLAWLQRERLVETYESLELLLLQTQIVLLACREMPSKEAIQDSSLNIDGSVEQIWERFRSYVDSNTNDYQVFRIGIYVLELLEFYEGMMSPDIKDLMMSGNLLNPGKAYMFAQPPRVRMCAEADLELLRRIKLDGEDADALVLLRAFSWIGSYFPESPLVRQLLARSDVTSALTTQYRTVPLSDPDLLRFGSNNLADAVSANAYTQYVEAHAKIPFTVQDLWLLAFLLKRQIQRQEWTSTTTHRRQRRQRSFPAA